MESTASVAVVGSYLVALVMEVERIPTVGETVHGSGYFQTHGGKGSNMAVQAARLGARRSFVGRVGDDGNGDRFRELLDEEGVDAAHLKQQPDTATGVGFIMLGPGGQNVISIDSGPNAAFSPADVDEAAASWPGTTTVLTQLEIPLATALHAMRVGLEGGLTTILNPAPAQPLLGSDLSNVSVITPNETEARVCLGLGADEEADEAELGRRLLELGCGAALVTLGERGCLCVTPDGAERRASRCRTWWTPPARATPSTPPSPSHYRRVRRSPMRRASPTPRRRCAARSWIPCRPTMIDSGWRALLELARTLDPWGVYPLPSPPPKRRRELKSNPGYDRKHQGVGSDGREYVLSNENKSWDNRGVKEPMDLC